MKTFDWSSGTVGFYLVASISCWRVVRWLSEAENADRREIAIWRCLTALLLALGISKQLDLQSAITEAGRVLSYAQGWYGQRRVVQLGFIFVFSAFAFASVIVLFNRTRHAASATRLALLGAVLLLSFVVIRAASFHHFDRFIGERFLGLKWNWILEIDGIAVILFASLWRHPQGLHLTFKDGLRRSTVRLRTLTWHRLAEGPVIVRRRG